MTVRAAREGDVELVAALIDDATAWVGELGFRQWPLPFPREEIAAAIARGEVFLAEVDGDAVATVTVLEADPFFWGTREPDALYVHKLAVRRDQAGRGIGAALVDWVDCVAVGSGREYLRLDCLRDDAGIRRYYERLGFEYRGDLDDVPRGLVVSLYERPVRSGRRVS